MVKKVIVWVAGILIGAILGYVVWNGIMDPNFFLGETKAVFGKIIDVFPSNEVKTFKRKVKYVYQVGDKYYVDFKKLGTNDEKQAIGNSVKVVYSINNPERNRVESLITNDTRYNKVKYYSDKEEGYMEVVLNNGVFNYKEYAGKGKIMNDFVGEYSIKDDSLKFEHYLSAESNLKMERPTLFIIDYKNENQLIESKTKRIFKRIK